METLSPSQFELIEKINFLKREKNALILVHNYLRSEIYEVADFLGDSLGLCERAAQSDASIIVFCAVHFMAESAALLLPDTKVLLPNYDAGCALADMITPRQLREFKAAHPGAATVCYINSSAEVKAESDVICTSSNAVDVVRALPHETILFVPDKNLSNFVAKQVPEKRIIPWDGHCPIHHRITLEQVLRAKFEYPDAKIIAHPECPPEVLEVADEVASTTGMVKYARGSRHDEFIILTECGLTQRMMIEMPRKKFVPVCNLCHDMKKTTLQSVYDALLHEQFHIQIPKEIATRARASFRRMFTLTEVCSTLPSLV